MSAKQKFRETKRMLHEAQDNLDDSLVDTFAVEGCGLNVSIITQLLDKERKYWRLLVRTTLSKRKKKQKQRRLGPNEHLW